MALTTRLALRNPIRNAGLLQVATVWYFYLYLTTILLSLVNSLNHISVIAAHALFLLTLLLLIRPRPVLRISFNLHAVVIGLLSSLVFLQGLFSVPNTTDSLVYHLPRIMYWIQGRSVLQSQTFT